MYTPGFGFTNEQGEGARFCSDCGDDLLEDCGLDGNSDVHRIGIGLEIYLQ